MGARELTRLAQAAVPTRKAPSEVTLAGGAVVVAGPEGYCVDRQASQLRGRPAFVLLVSCSSLTGSAEGWPAAPGLLTASVERDTGGLPDLAALRGFLGSEPGRAALARDGRADAVTLLDSKIELGALLLKIEDRGQADIPSLSPTYWRGIFVLNARMVTVSVNSFEARAIPDDAARRKLLQFIGQIRQESPALETAQNQSVDEAGAGGETGEGGFFRRLLR